MTDGRAHRRRWRFYESEGGKRPVREFLDEQTAQDAADIVAALQALAEEGTAYARHLRGPIWEVRVDGLNRAFRVLFSTEGRFQHVLLALEAFVKKTQKTPKRTLELAEQRLADWRARGRRE